MTLTVELDTQQSLQLEESARRLNVTAAELARAAITEMLKRQDEKFDPILEHVLSKNAELYRRLA